MCHVIFHAYFNFTYAIQGRFYIKVAVYTNGFMSVRLSKIVIWDWVENVKSTLKYCINTHCIACEYYIYPRHGQIQKKTLSHNWCGFDFHFNSPIYIFQDTILVVDHFHLNNKYTDTDTKNTLCAKHKVHPRSRLQLISASHLSCFHFHLKHHFVIILLWLFGYNNGLLTKLTLFISIILDA